MPTGALAAACSAIALLIAARHAGALGLARRVLVTSTSPATALRPARRRRHFVLHYAGLFTDPGNRPATSTSELADGCDDTGYLDALARAC